MKCIVGLGNPGKEYEQTRHNVGFMVIDSLARGSIKSEKSSKLYWHALLKVENFEVVLVKPKTFMNLSGQAVLECFSKFCESKPDNLLVVVDDVNLPLGQIRIRSKGSSGGHNGLESIVSMLGTNDFPRLRIGVGQEGLAGQDLTDFVLGPFAKSEKPSIEKAVDRAAQGCLDWVQKGLVEVMNLYNPKDKT